MIISDSKSAIQRIALPPITDTATHQTRDLARRLANRRQIVAIKWIPGHVAISGDVRVDFLAGDAHCSIASVNVATDHRVVVRYLKWFLQDTFDRRMGRRKQVLRLSRQEPTAVADYNETCVLQGVSF